MKLKTDRKDIAAATCAANSRTGQQLASTVNAELRALPLNTGSITALAQVMCPAKTVAASLKALRERIGEVRAFLDGLPQAFTEVEARSAPIRAACQARIEEIGVEITELAKDLRSDEFAVLRPANAWNAWVSKGLSREQILKLGIPEPTIRDQDEARPVISTLHRKYDAAVAQLTAERNELQAFINSGFDPRKAPASIRDQWSSPLGDGALEGL